MNGELLHIVESLHREKEIEKEIIFQGIENALKVAAQKRFGQERDVRINLNRETGKVVATLDGEPLQPVELGRIAAHLAKQLIMQKIREAEAEVVYKEYRELLGCVVPGRVQRIERGSVIVELERTEGVLHQKGRIPGENYRAGARMRFLVVDVTLQGQKVKVELNRSSEDFLRHLFENEVPEIQEGIVEIVGVARDAGHRAKVAVRSKDARVDPVGACVGVKGARIRSIVEELNGERIDIVAYSDTPEEFIAWALKLNEDIGITTDKEHKIAYVTVPSDKLSIAIGKHGQNVHLASQLTGWQIEIAPEEVVLDIQGVPAEVINNLQDAGFDTLEDLKNASIDELCRVDGVDEGAARKIKEFIERMEEKLVFGEGGEGQEEE